jgi:uncharacterized protein YjbI with pentapeptide repeats
MADDEHVAMLKQGVSAWNAWRNENPGISPDLSGADLKNVRLCVANLGGRELTEVNEADFIGAILRGANLSTEADLSAYLKACYNANVTAYFTEEPTANGRAYIQIDLTSPNAHGELELYATHIRRGRITGANLFEANLTNANLSDANLRWANLSFAHLVGANFGGANLSEANLSSADLSSANLEVANLTRANLTGARLIFTRVWSANLSEADLNKAYLASTNFGEANLTKANLTEANLFSANLRRADLTAANLTSADLFEANLTNANLTEANLTGAVLKAAILINTNLTGADLTGCRIHGVSAWGVKLERAKQQNLIITDADEPTITVDNIEVAQFIYLLLHNDKIRQVIDTITSKAVLILGRFTDERKAVLDALREELRKRDYLPILFDFEKPRSRDTDETITLLARMARFVIADISDA